MVAPTTLPTVWWSLAFPLRFPAPGSSPGVPASSGVRADIRGQPRERGSTAGRGRRHSEHTGCDQSVTSTWPWVQFGGALALESAKDETAQMRRLVSVLVPLGSVIVAACSSAAPASSSGAEPAAQSTQTRSVSSTATGFTPWSTYHRTASRSGRTANPPGVLHRSWSMRLGNAVYGEPLVVGS